jgi:hypothetical protein
MGFLKFRSPSRPAEAPVVDDERPQDGENVAQVSEKNDTVVDTKSDSDDEFVNKDFQHGVQAAQAMTQVWTLQHLIIAYVLYVTP